MFLTESSLSEEQHEAVELCGDLSKRIVGVTGEAGSGKTSVLRFVHAYLSENPNNRIALIAPTGRAAKRITEATGIPAQTIHRFMRYSVPDDDDDFGLPAYNKFNKFDFNVILVDESSMVNDELYRNVIDAMPGGGAIRFFGDANQLPPVEGKSPFLELLERFPSIRLTKNFRSDDGIVTAARAIIQGRIPQPNEKFTMLNPGIGNLLPAVDKFIDDTFRGMAGQLIIPIKGGKYGTIPMNAYLQQKLNPGGKPFVYTFEDKRSNETVVRKFKKGDKIIWTKNDYKLNLFNGMIGWVDEIDYDTGEITLNIDDKSKVIPTHLESFDPGGRSIFAYDPRKNLELAYAITTHKAQGSEFDKVVLLLNKSFVLNRANFYTAVTRARNSVAIILGSGALATAMRK